MASPVKDAEWLRWIERLLGQPGEGSTPAGASRPPFSCCLDEQPDHLAPEYALQSAIELSRNNPPLYFNPDCWFGKDGIPPKQIAEAMGMLNGLIGETTNLVCVRDVGSGILQPFSLGPTLRVLLDQSHPMDPSPPELPERARNVLAMAGVLVPENWASMCRGKWSTSILQGASTFRQRGFLPVRQLIHPFFLAALRRYYRHLVRRDLMTLGDGQCKRRYVAHNDPVASFFHQQLAPVVSALVEQTVKPSYVYVGGYQEGAVLKKHTDREQCEFSVSLCLDYSPEPQLETPWPIQLHTGFGTTTIFQAIGDALLYRGCDIPHSRGRLPRGHSSTSVFFHYVSHDFSGSLN